ncbi:amino acid adenylation domain-containing protein [Oscillospiraceae bacterium 38-13]
MRWEATTALLTGFDSEKRSTDYVIGGVTWQYREFAIEKHDYTQAAQYRRSVFSDEPPVLEMNTDYPRQSRQTFSGAALYEEFSGSLHERICEKCKMANITPYAFYMGAFYILLSNFSGNEDIVVGVPASGRSGKFLNTIGMFVNTLAMRNRPEGGKTVSAFLQEVKNATIQALNNQEYPFGELVKELNVHAENRHPLFDVIFAYQSGEMTDIRFEDKPVELLPIPITIAKCDFTFNIYPRPGDIVIMVEYCTDLYKEQTIRRLLEGYRIILAQMLDGEKRLSDISAVTYSEKQQLLYSFNDTAADYPRDKCVHTMFEEQAEKTPDQNAVIACDRTLTYRELNEQANRIAHSLIEHGIKPGDIVAFALPRRSYLIAAMFGILKAGAAYLPIDPDYPQDRIAYMLEDSRAACFITEENIQSLVKNKNSSNLSLPVSSDSLCYCIYTSGSTGKPKGALLTHQNIGNYVSKGNNGIVYSVISDNCKSIVSLAVPGFDMFTTEGVLSAVNGMTILLADEEQTKIQSELNEFLSRNPANVLQTTPTKIRMLICDASQLEYLESLKVVLLGGEIVDDAIVSELKRITTAHIFNMYGPTETTVWSTKTEILSVDDITIGKPINNTQIYIVDKHLQLVPIGVTGELCIAGDGVGAGYLNRPELTAEKFIDNPFGAGKLYKTGDLAYWREDGNIVYVGRNDFQVKIRGLRIELGEIENALQAIESVSQTAVVVRKNESGHQLICAFYTGQEMDSRTFRTAIGQKLPKYMLPHSFTHLEMMPLTSSGKINRKALPDIDLNNIASAVEYVAPIGEMEKRLAALMEEVLGYSPVGRADNFFDLGGDSLRAIEFVTKAHGEGIYFALQNIFNYPTVESLCNYLQDFPKKDEVFTSAQFQKYTSILERNTWNPDFVPERHELGTVLLTGGTGFLGAHILDALMNHGVTKIYCVVRGGEDKLRRRLQYYFGGRYAGELGSMIIPITGDLEHKDIVKGLPENVDYVIHAAASVKHYGSWQYFKSANIDATQNIISYAKRIHAKLFHVSTISVSGNSMADQFDGYISEEEKHFSESSLYIAQPLDNVYVRSKFEAEALVLDAIREGLQANIVRMGNLTNRKSDLKFQPNYTENAFLKRVKAVLELGCVPDYLMSIYTEFSPVDAAAEAITRIAEHMNDRYTVFHINSDKELFLDRMLDYLEQAGHPLKVVTGEKFARLIRDTINSQQSYIFEALLNDLDQNDQIQYDSNIRIENCFTVQYLQRLGFEWPEIDHAYIEGYLQYFTQLGYFGGEIYDAK